MHPQLYATGFQFARDRIWIWQILLLITFSSLVLGDTTANLLLGDSSIGESDIRLRGKIVGSIIGVDLTATTYDVSCATTGPIEFPFTTPACINGSHVTITQGQSTMLFSEIFTTASTFRNLHYNCSYSNTETVTCSISNTISEVLAMGGQTTTTSYIETSSTVNASPSNPPLYFAVTITAGLEKLAATQSTATADGKSGTVGSKTATSPGSATSTKVSSPAIIFAPSLRWVIAATLFGGMWSSF